MFLSDWNGCCDNMTDQFGQLILLEAWNCPDTSENYCPNWISTVELGDHSSSLASSQHRNFATSWHCLSRISGSLRNIANLWLRLSRFFDNPLRNVATSQLCDFGTPEFFTTLNCIDPKLHIGVTLSIIWLGTMVGAGGRDVAKASRNSAELMPWSCKVTMLRRCMTGAMITKLYLSRSEL